MDFEIPNRILNEGNEIRGVGYEIEFTGMTLQDAAETVKGLFGGERVVENKFNQEIRKTKHGDFKIKLDTSLLTERMYIDFLKKFGVDISGQPVQITIEDVLEKISSLIIPYEIAAPPVPVTDMTPIEKLREALRKQGAAGSKDSIVNAFGLHINIETPSMAIKTIVDYLRAFFLLYDWIYKASDIDFTRLIPPFINEFPQEYVEMVLEPSYQPDWKRFISDYLSNNPTRNRTLDMLPVLAFNDDKVITALDDVHIKPRPAFHYRLPNSLVDDPEWSIAREWNRWNSVETLANMPEKMTMLTKTYLDTKKSIDPGKKKWYTIIKEWLQEKDMTGRSSE